MPCPKFSPPASSALAIPDSPTRSPCRLRHDPLASIRVDDGAPSSTQKHIVSLAVWPHFVWLKSEIILCSTTAGLNLQRHHFVVAIEIVRGGRRGERRHDRQSGGSEKPPHSPVPGLGALSPDSIATTISRMKPGRTNRAHVCSPSMRTAIVSPLGPIARTALSPGGSS